MEVAFIIAPLLCHFFSTSFISHLDYSAIIYDFFIFNQTRWRLFKKSLSSFSFPMNPRVWFSHS